MIEVVNLKNNPGYFNVFLDHLYEEYKEYFEHKSKDDVAEFYKKLIPKTYIMLKDKEFIGCYSIHGCFIADVFIVPKHRSKGLGTVLINDAKKRMFTCVRWELYSTLKTVSFYEHLGFVVNAKKDKTKLHMVQYNRQLLIFLASLLIGVLVFFLF